jgi:nicotinamide-nucleotide amidase
MTGSELMSGDTVDTNSSYLAQALLSISLSIHEIATVGDQHNLLLNQIQRLSRNSDLLIINGGLGPTQDDLTSEVLANVAKVAIETHQEAKQHIIDWCERKKIIPNLANFKQAELPANCSIFADAPGSAPAFYLTIGKCLVIATPGVPSELKHITQQQMLPFLTMFFSAANTVHWKKIQLIGIGESRLQSLLHDEYKGIDEFIDIGFRARFPTLELKYKPQASLSITDKQFLLWEEKLLNALHDFTLGKGDFHLPTALIDLLSRQEKTITCAESCTGGLIASEITKVPGASKVFHGGIVSYSNTVKSQLLDVPLNTLELYGAVSQETVLAMLKGCLMKIHAHYGIAVSGIAGPNGGSEKKPVGTVWIAWGDNKKPLSVCLHIPFERKQFQMLVTIISLDLIRRYALGELAIPNYLKRWQL